MEMTGSRRLLVEAEPRRGGPAPSAASGGRNVGSSKAGAGELPRDARTWRCRVWNGGDDVDPAGRRLSDLVAGRQTGSGHGGGAAGVWCRGLGLQGRGRGECHPQLHRLLALHGMLCSALLCVGSFCCAVGYYLAFIYWLQDSGLGMMRLSLPRLIGVPIGGSWCPRIRDASLSPVLCLIINHSSL